MKYFLPLKVDFNWIKFELHRIKQIPSPILIFKIGLRLIGLTVGIVLLPLTLFLHLVGYRHVTVFTDRIGHLALELDCLIKEQQLGLISARKWLILAPPNRVANNHLLNYWQPFVHVISNRVICFLVASMSRWGLMRFKIDRYVRATYKVQAAYGINAKWADRSPILSLTSEDQKWGADRLKELGLPERAWFVCVHAREGGYSPIDEELHIHRNCRIENTISAMQEITSRGGWVIRIGDPSMQRLVPMDKVIDYAHHPLKSQRLDIILCAMARFILGNTSGISLVGTVFGVPCALANMVPLAALGVGNRDISIPKLYWSLNENRHLTFMEIFASKASQYHYNSEFVLRGLEPVENSLDEIKELAIDMMERHGDYPSSKHSDVSLSDEFISMLGPNHYSFGASSCVSESFLKRHLSLLIQHE